MSDDETPGKAAIAATFALSRKSRDPMFRAYVRELLAVGPDAPMHVNWVVAMPGQTVSEMFRRIDHAEMPAIIAMPDESQPFGYRMAVVTGPDVATVAGWRSTLAIHEDPELYAALTAPVDEDDLPDEAPVLAAAARRPRRFRRG